MNASPLSSPGQALRVIQISDCHVSAETGPSYRGLDPRAGLEAVLGAATAWRPDLVLATGDLSDDASDASYRYLAERLAGLGAPVLALPGNHDLASRQSRFFADCPVEEPLVRDSGGWRLILLNSAAEGFISGQLSDRMLAGLDRALDETSRPKLLALHHQPIPVGSPWIDRYPLEETARLWAMIEGRDDIRAIVWGHVHQPFAAWRGATRLLGGPSTATNSLPGQDAFSADPRGPACRWLKLGAEGRLTTGVLRGAAGLSRAAGSTTG